MGCLVIQRKRIMTPMTLRDKSCQKESKHPSKYNILRHPGVVITANHQQHHPYVVLIKEQDYASAGLQTIFTKLASKRAHLNLTICAGWMQEMMGQREIAISQRRITDTEGWFKWVFGLCKNGPQQQVRQSTSDKFEPSLLLDISHQITKYEKEQRWMMRRYGNRQIGGHKVVVRSTSKV